MNVEKIKQDFPILQRKINGKRLVYVDNAATTQKPSSVLKAMDRYYLFFNANVHRSPNTLGEEATIAYENAHKAVAQFINARSWQEVIFTKNTTEGMNLLAYAYGMNFLKQGDEIILSEMEHHSSLVPWQQIAKRTGAKVKYIPLLDDGTLDMKAYQKLLSSKTKIVCVCHVSNALGTINDVKTIAKYAHEQQAICIVDGAQSVPHMKIDVQDLDCDFLLFSGHKMLGPTGIGVLVGKKDLLEKMPPFLYGGDMISEVTYQESTWNELPWKFEAGTPPIAEAVGLKVAIDYLQKIGMEQIHAHEQELIHYAQEVFSTLKDVTMYGPEKKAGILSFTVKGIHPHDLASILDRHGVMIRGGHHCAMPLMKKLGITGTARASFYLYNTKEDIDKIKEAILDAQRIFK
ncbi:cysteine desulfurase [Candidatus Woesearchaeota archaeon]|nr:cysteine desulfurase [Candidatus Woesearchaeota archaeon]